MLNDFRPLSDCCSISLDSRLHTLQVAKPGEGGCRRCHPLSPPPGLHSSGQGKWHCENHVFFKLLLFLQCIQLYIALLPTLFTLPSLIEKLTRMQMDPPLEMQHLVFEGVLGRLLSQHRTDRLKRLFVPRVNRLFSCSQWGQRGR